MARRLAQISNFSISPRTRTPLSVRYQRAKRNFAKRAWARKNKSNMAVRKIQRVYRGFKGRRRATAKKYHSVLKKRIRGF